MTTRDGKDSSVETIAIRLTNVTKEYRLYERPQDRMLDQIGLNRLLFWRKPTAYKLFHALNGIDITIKRGERVGIIGRNGAGKTTMLKLITGNFNPTEGELEVKGSVQALMQLGIGFHPEFSGYENIRAALHYNGLIGKDFDDALADVVDFVELGEFLSQPMKTYSLGMNARVQFAAATAIKPDILIIDEVLGAGDAYFTAKSTQRVRHLTERDCTLLLVSHSTPQVLQFCSRAIWLEQGRVVMDGPAKDIIGAYEVFSENRIRASRRQETETQEEEIRSKKVAVLGIADKSWIADRIVAREHAIGLNSGDKLESTFSRDEFQVVLENGLSVYRWPGKVGLKFSNVCLLNETDEPTNVLATLRKAKLSCTVVKESADRPIDARVFVAVFNMEAQRLAWLTSPLMTFKGPVGGRHMIEIALEPLLLGGGTYVLSVSLFETDDLLHLSADQRFDLLARCLEFKVIEFDGRESPVFHHPAKWKVTSLDAFGNHIGSADV